MRHAPRVFKPRGVFFAVRASLRCNAETGAFRYRRKFGDDGQAYKDMDTAGSHRPYDHIHDWKGKQRAKVPRKPNKQEKAELKKAKNKRRFL